MTVSPPFLYRVFGLIVCSDFALDELAPCDDPGKPDVIVKRVRFGSPLPDADSAPSFDYNAPAGVEMIWPGVAAFRIVNNGLIECEPYPDTPPNFIAFPLLGPIFGWLLDQIGYLVLHASAVTYNDRCVAFLGDKMAGKSTTAAAFLRSGAKLVTDDLLVIDLETSTKPVVHPAFAQLKLADDAAASIELAGAQPLPLVFEDFPKRQHRLDSMHSAATTIDRLYILERGSGAARIEPLAPTEALKAVMRYSYAIRFARAPLDPAQRSRHFRHCAALAATGGVAILHVTHDLDAMDTIVSTVAADLAAALARD